MIRYLVKAFIRKRGNRMAEFRVWILKVKPTSEILAMISDVGLFLNIV